MSDLLIREARAEDLEAIIRLHEEDELGSHGDIWSPETKPAYEAAFAAIKRSPDAPNVRAGEVSNVDAMKLAVQPMWLHLLTPVLSAAGVLLGARMKGRGDA